MSKAPITDLNGWIAALTQPTALMELASLVVCALLAWWLASMVCNALGARDKSSIMFGRRIVDGVLFPALLAALIGFLDDRQALTPYLRLAMQAGVAALAWVLGTRLSITGIVALDALILVLWVLVLINGINLLDNSDGLAGATVLISSFGAAVIAVMYGQILVSILGFAIAGVTVGFLWHNWFPAKVYMGDAGAYFLGFLLAILTVRLKPTGAPVLVGVVIAILLVLVPLFDTTFVVINRLRQGIHPFTAGRDHLSHVLQGRNLSVAWSVAALQLLGVAGVGGAVILAAAYR